MNKNFLTNFVAIVLIIISYFIPSAFFQSLSSNMGYFALSGAITNWLAIHMLFERVPFMYGSGVILNRFEAFKRSIKDMIMEQFFTEANLEKVMGNISHTPKQWEALADKIDYDKIFISLKEAVNTSSFGGIINMVGGDKALNSLKGPMEEHLRKSLTEMLQDEDFQHDIVATISSSNTHTEFSQTIEKVVDERMQDLTPIKVKTLVQKLIREHLDWLIVWGGVCGAGIGIIKSII